MLGGAQSAVQVNSFDQVGWADFNVLYWATWSSDDFLILTWLFSGRYLNNYKGKGVLGE